MILPLLLALSAPPTFAQEAPGDLASAWGVSPSATWIFVLETAGEMRTEAEAAREPIARLVEALPAGDSVEIVAVHTRSGAPLARKVVDDANRAEVAAEIRKLELPSAKSLDLGVGLVELASRLEAVAEGTPRFVMYLGSFCHTPPLGSAYAEGGYGCRTIRGFDELDETFDGAGRGTLAGVTLFPVSTPKQPAHDAGVETVRKWLEPSASVARADVPFATWADALRGRLAAERYTPLARAEAARLALSATVAEAPTAERPSGTLTLATGLEHLGFAARRVSIEGATTSQAGPLHLGPTGTLAFAVTVPEPPFSLVPTRDFVELPVRITVEGELTPGDALRAAGVDPGRTLTADLVVRAERQYGLSLGRSVAMFGSALLMTGALGLTARRRFAPLRLGGAFTYRHGGGPKRTLPIEHLPEAAIVVLPDGTLGLGRREDAALVIWVERPLWNTHAAVEIRGADIEINARPAAPGRHSVIQGATSFLFQDYRLSWE